MNYERLRQTLPGGPPERDRGLWPSTSRRYPRAIMPRPHLRAVVAALLAALIVLPDPQVAAAATGTLVVRVTDAATGKPIPARLSLRAADGKYPGDRIGLAADQWPNLD